MKYWMRCTEVAMPRKPEPKKAPVKKCPDCGKKMAAFVRGNGWVYHCADEGKHAEAKLRAQQQSGLTGKGGVKKGTPSPMLGRERNKKPRAKWYWGKEKDPRKDK
jgi:hypothetical protein